MQQYTTPSFRTKNNDIILELKLNRRYDNGKEIRIGNLIYFESTRAHTFTPESICEIIEVLGRNHQVVADIVVQKGDWLINLLDVIKDD